MAGPGLAFVALGRAERAFDEFLQLAQVKGKKEFVIQKAPTLLRDRPVVYAQLALIRARLQAVRAWLYAILEQQVRRGSDGPGVSEKASLRNSLGTRSRRTAMPGTPSAGTRFNCQAICCTGTCTR